MDRNVAVCKEEIGQFCKYSSDRVLSVWCHKQLIGRILQSWQCITLSPPLLAWVYFLRRARRRPSVPQPTATLLSRNQAAPPAGPQTLRPLAPVVLQKDARRLVLLSSPPLSLFLIRIPLHHALLTVTLHFVGRNLLFLSVIKARRGNMISSQSHWYYKDPNENVRGN